MGEWIVGTPRPACNRAVRRNGLRTAAPSLVLFLLLAGAGVAAAGPGADVAAAQNQPSDAGGAGPDSLWRRSGDIRKVQLHRYDVFTGEEGGVFQWVYKIMNALHTTTKPFVIHNEILIREGEPFDSLKMVESVRLLRQRGIFEEVKGWLEPADSGVVAHIQTRDYWTLDLQTGFGKEGGETDVVLGLLDSNFFGTGNLFSFTRRWSTDKSQSRWAFFAPRLLGRRENVAGEYRDNTDGIVKAVFAGHEYENPLAPWSYGFSGYRFRGRYPIYESAEEKVRIRLEEHVGGFHLGYYPGRNVQFGGGVGFYLYDFEPDTLQVFEELETPLERPDPRRLRMPFVTVGLQQRRFVQTMNLDQFGVVEDYPIGWNIQAQLGRTLSDLGGKGERSYTAFQTRVSAPLGGGFWGSATGSGGMFWKDGLAGERRARARTMLFRRHSPWALSALQVSGQIGEDAPVEERRYLGGSSGLRGYPVRSFEARDYLLVNFEHRIWTPLRIHIFRFGFSAFWDTGLAAGLGRPIDEFSWKHGAGAGLLIGNRKSASGILRVEVARRLDGGDAWDFTIAMSHLLQFAPRLTLAQPALDVFDHLP